jgi:hypothetical protein
MAAAVTAPSRSTTDDRDPGAPRRRWIVPACTLVVLVLYAVSAIALGRHATGSDLHRLQAEALADGHLDIRPVPTALSELDDPYDPGANLDVRIDEGVQDLAYRDGRLYSAHGLTTPVLLLPSEVLFGTAPPNWAITLIAGWGGALAGVWILLQLRRRFVPAASDVALGSTVLAFGLCGPVWVLMSTGNGYEAAIAVAFALTTLGAALLLRSTESLPALGRGRAALGSSCLAAAIGARPTAVVTVIVVGVVAAVVVVADRRAPRAPGSPPRRTTAAVAADLACVVAPFVAIGALIAAANIVRFGEAGEFGFGYQLSVWDMTAYPKGRLAYLAPNLADYLTAAPRLGGRFPWIGLRDTVGGVRPEDHTSEPIVGLVFLAPVLVVGAAGLATRSHGLRTRGRGLAVALATAVATGVAALVAVSLPFNTSTLRYAADAAPMLLLAAGAAWLWARGPGGRPSDDGPDDGTDADHGSLDLAWAIALALGVALTAAVQVGA